MLSDFRDLLIAASLKRFSARKRLFGALYFRDLLIAASLKPSLGTTIRMDYLSSAIY